MKKYEKQSLVKFTLIYFFSTSIFIIVLGYLYYAQQESQILKKYTMNMHQYNINLQHNDFNYKQKGLSFQIVNKNIYKYKFATKVDNVYKKTFNLLKNTKYILVSLEKEIVDNELMQIKKFTITAQLVLLIVFFIISFILAKLSLKPMNDTISHLDRFLNDLIHDLNTPATSILLNIKMLEKDFIDTKSIKKLNRIKSSITNITSLYDDLEIIIKPHLAKENIDIYPLLSEQKEYISLQFPKLQFNIEKTSMIVFTNTKAIHRILDNIISNSCKYAKNDGTVNIKFTNNTLIISDNGKGMKYPQKIFERSYSENEQGHGIGMHIVQRLCHQLDIDIKIDSKENIGTTIQLKFK